MIYQCARVLAQRPSVCLSLSLSLSPSLSLSLGVGMCMWTQPFCLVDSTVSGSQIQYQTPVGSRSLSTLNTHWWRGRSQGRTTVRCENAPSGIITPPAPLSSLFLLLFTIPYSRFLHLPCSSTYRFSLFPHHLVLLLCVRIQPPPSGNLSSSQCLADKAWFGYVKGQLGRPQQGFKSECYHWVSAAVGNTGWLMGGQLSGRLAGVLIGWPSRKVGEQLSCIMLSWKSSASRGWKRGGKCLWNTSQYYIPSTYAFYRPKVFYSMDFVCFCCRHFIGLEMSLSCRRSSIG